MLDWAAASNTDATCNVGAVTYNTLEARDKFLLRKNKLLKLFFYYF